jgi:hypothetical protein
MADINGQLGSVMMTNTLRLSDFFTQSADIALPVGVKLNNNRDDAKVTLQNRMATIDMGVTIQVPTPPAGAYTKIGTIPEGFRPRNYLVGVAMGINDGADALYRYSINKLTGEIIAKPMTGATINGSLSLLLTYEIA